MIETLKLPEGVEADYSTRYADEIANSVRQVASEYAEAGERAGIDPDYIYEAMQPVNRAREVAVGEVNGVSFVSTRVCVGVPGSGRTYRGGLEWMAPPTKAAKKATTMVAKHDVARTEDEGGKGGLWVPPEQQHLITPTIRRKLLITHAIMHGINGRTNATATDIGTFTDDMNVIIEGLYPYLGEEAYAAASGADREHHGIPDFQLQTTGIGASIVLGEYLAARKKHGGADDEIAHKLRQGIPLRILQQALGKAGAPFALHPPVGTELAGAMERSGAIYDPSKALDPEEIIKLAHLNGLAEGSAKDGQKWIPPNVHEFWPLDADVLVAAFDSDQIDDEDISNTSAEVVVSISNRGVTAAGREKADELEIDVVNDALTNMGGTVGSSKRGNMLLYGKYRSVGALKTSWNADMHGISQRVFETMYERRQTEDTYLSPEDVVLGMIARRAAARRHAALAAPYRLR